MEWRRQMAFEPFLPLHLGLGAGCDLLETNAYASYPIWLWLNGQARGIDTSKVELHLLSGEYAQNAGPTGAAAIAFQIEGAAYAVIRGDNYHLVTDDYSRFRQALVPS
jgi:hypothetical protein